jgi:hypothetical protein
MMGFAAHRDHRIDARRGAGVNIALAEISIVRQQRFDVAQFVGQISELAEHRLKLLLVVRRLHHIGRDHQQTACRHCRLRVVALLKPAARHWHDPRFLVGQIDLIGAQRAFDRRRRRAASGLLAGRRGRGLTRLEP